MSDNNILVELQVEFLKRYNRSLDKERLLENEIHGYTSLLNDAGLLPRELSFEDEPLSKYSIQFSSMQIFIIREFYKHFFIEGADILELEDDKFNTWFSRLNEFTSYYLTESSNYYYHLAHDLGKYQTWIKGFSNQCCKSIVSEADINKIVLIFDHYKDNFTHETSKSFRERFCYPNASKIEPMELSPQAKNNSSRLILIAILSSIQYLTKNSFDYDDFVLKRFGLKAFSKARSTHKHKPTFVDTEKYCNRIFNL